MHPEMKGGNREALAKAGAIPPVIASSPDWHLSGVTVFLANLFRELSLRGGNGTLLLTNPGPDKPGWQSELNGSRVRLPATQWGEVRVRQDLVRRHLLSRNGCVYLPNYDFDMGGICPALPEEVIVVGVLHSDEPAYYQFFRDYGSYWNHTVAVSEQIYRTALQMRPDLEPRLSVVSYGVAIPPRPRIKGDGPLRVSYCGRLTKHQKRIDLLAEVVRECSRRNLAIEFSIAGSGQDEALLRDLAVEPLRAGKVRFLGALANDAVLKLLGESDVLILTSEFEGLPVVILEAMSQGCVPVVSAVSSGVSQLVEEGRNGFLVPVGDVNAFAARLGQLASNRELARNLGAAAFRTVQAGPYSSAQSAANYFQVFENCHEEVRRGGFKRPQGRMEIPDYYRLTTRVGRRLRKLLTPDDREPASAGRVALQSAKGAGR